MMSVTTYYFFTRSWDATPTSRVHGIGKAAALKKYATSLHFREQAKVFNSFSTVDDILADFACFYGLNRRFFGERYGLQGYLNMVARIIDSGALSRQNMVKIEFIDEDELPIANFVEHPMTV